MGCTSSVSVPVQGEEHTATKVTGPRKSDQAQARRETIKGGGQDFSRLLGRTTSTFSGKNKTNGKDGCISRSNLIADNTGSIHAMYKLEKKNLGEGAYGTVCRATHKQTQAACAVKKIRKKVRNDKENERVVAEVEILKMADHPHIIKLFEDFEDAWYFYVVTEMCTGGELFDRIVEAGNGFSEVQAAILVQQMLGSVSYLHKNFVMHRDLKPENFLFQASAPLESSILKLIDFGLAVPFREDQRFDEKLGSAYYIAPEVIAKDYGHECDVWSLGVITFVLLCGHPPFNGNTDKEIMVNVEKGNFEFDPTEWSGVSEDAKECVNLMLSVDVSKRATAESALTNTWVKDKAPKASGTLCNSLVENLTKFKSQNRLKKAALQVIVSRLSDDHISSLRDAFKAIDVNGDGQLSHEELKAGLSTANLAGMSEQDFQRILDGVDADGSGEIDYTEFIAAALDEKLYMKESICYEAFTVFDRDGDGKISKEELSLVLEDDGSDNVATAKAMMELIQAVDDDGDGYIDFKEFLAMMRSDN